MVIHGRKRDCSINKYITFILKFSFEVLQKMLGDYQVIFFCYHTAQGCITSATRTKCTACSFLYINTFTCKHPGNNSVVHFWNLCLGECKQQQDDKYGCHHQIRGSTTGVR